MRSRRNNLAVTTEPKTLPTGTKVIEVVLWVGRHKVHVHEYGAHLGPQGAIEAFINHLMDPS